MQSGALYLGPIYPCFFFFPLNCSYCMDLLIYGLFNNTVVSQIVYCGCYRCEFTSSDTVSLMVQVAPVAHRTPNKRHAVARNGLIQKCSMLFRELTRWPNSNQVWLLYRTSVGYIYRWCTTVTAEARVRCRTSLCEVCGGHSDNGNCPPTPLAL